MTWNPKVARLYGPEWPVTKDLPSLINSNARSHAVSVPSTVNEDIGGVTLYTEGFGAFPVGITCDVFDQAFATSAGIERLGYNAAHPYALPNGDADIGNHLNQSGGSTNLYQSIDDGATIDESNYITATQLGNYKGVLNVAVTNSGCSQWAAKRITRVDFDVYARCVGGSGFLLPFLTVNGSDIPAQPLGWPDGDQSLQQSHSSWILNPQTGKPWTATDIERFAFADQFRLVWAGGNALSTYRAYSVAMVIYWVNETRKASCTSIPAFYPAWTSFDIDTPDYFNALTVQQASTEGAGTLGWTAGPSTSIARSTVQAASGVASLLMTATAAATISAGTGSIDLTESIAVFPGQVWSVAAKFRAASVGRLCRVEATWADSVGTPISTVLGTNVTDSSSHFNTQAELEGAVVPAGAAYLNIVVKAIGCANGEGHYVDEVMALPDVLAPAGFVPGAGRRAYFSKRNAKTYLYSFHRSSENGAAKVFGPTADVACPHGVKNYKPSIASFSGVGQVGVLGSLGSPSLTAAPILLVTPALGISVDSQPYVGLDPLQLVYSGNDAEQEFTASVSDTRKVVALLLDPGDATADLSVKIKRRSDNSQLGSSTITITPAEVRALGDGLVFVVKTMTTGIAMAAFTQYYVELSSAAASSAPWHTAVLYDGELGSGATFGGITDRFNENDHRDLFFLLASEPSPITNFVVVDNASPFPHAQITWDAVVDANFTRYEIERDDGNGFEVIKTITTPTTTSFDDYEGRRGVTSTYRVRWFRDEFIPSSYTATGIATPAIPTKTFLFVSNDLDSSMFFEFYKYEKAARQFQLPDTLQTLDLYDSNNRSASRGTERRGDRWATTLLVAGSNVIPPSVVGRRAFDPFLALIRSDVEYVTIHDRAGSRWHAAITATSAAIEQPGGVYTLDIEVIELVPSG